MKEITLKNISLVALILSIFISCNNTRIEKPNTINDSQTQELIHTTNRKQSTEINTRELGDLNFFEVDEFLIPDSLFKCKKKFKDCGLVKDGILSSEQVWLTNEDKTQIIAIQLYTDNYRNYFYYFSTDEIPIKLIHRMELHTKNGEIATQKQKEQNFGNLYKQSKVIRQKYFKSKKNLTIGDSIEKALKIYGKPDEKTNFEGVQKLCWKFVGDTFYEESNLKDKVAKNSYGHQTTMFFKNYQLIGMILHNEIP